MKNRLFIIAVSTFLIFTPLEIQQNGKFLTGFICQDAWAIESPVGSGTVPPSSRRSGLIRSPNPMDTSSNLVVTGNIRGGRHFRGIVPYRATSDFGTGIGSSTLDSFLRYSAGSEDFGTFTGKQKPYYSPTRTVTTTRPGRPGIFSPALRSGTPYGATKINYRATTTGRVDDLAVLQSNRFTVSPLPLLRRSASTASRPMSMSPREMEKVISSELADYPQARKLIILQQQQQMEQFHNDLKRISGKVDDELKQSPIEKNDSYTKQDTGDEQQITNVDIYEIMKWQIDNFQKGLVQQDSPGEPSTAIQQAVDSQKESGQEQKLSALAKDILGSHKTFASFSNDKFNRHIWAAEEYLKQGRYYRAADAYTLASIYKPADPLAYAGKSHALFAAGEYMSSALFLSRALDIFPEYARFKIDLVTMVGDKDKLESRIVDIEQWLERSNAGELQFLLGYVYHQMDRSQLAKEAIDAAYEKMPSSPAVIALKKAIESPTKKAAP